MTQNTEIMLSMAPTSLATLAFNDRKNKNGKVLGSRFNLVGARGTPLEIKAELLKANPKLSNRELKEKVNAVRRGDASLAWMTADVAYAALRASGEVVPRFLDRNKKETLFAMSFEKLAAAKAAIEAPALTEEQTNVLSKIAELQKGGMSIDNIMALLGK